LFLLVAAEDEDRVGGEALLHEEARRDPGAHARELLHEDAFHDPGGVRPSPFLRVTHPDVALLSEDLEQLLGKLLCLLRGLHVGPHDLVAELLDGLLKDDLLFGK
jgi:hypothetical protein